MDVELDYCDRAAAWFIAPWNCSPRLISLWYMFKQYMTPIAAIVAHELNMFTHLEAVMVNWDGKLDVDDHMVGEIRERSGGAVKLASDLNLKMTTQKTQMLTHCLAHNIRDVETLRNRMREVRETMIQELQSINFLPVTEDMETYLDKPTPFGASVSSVFPEASEDVYEAHQCFAFGQYTATAFHISRAMEIVVRQVALKMKAKPTRDEWQSYINAMDEVIKKMPFKTTQEKEKRAIYSEASNYLFNFKEAFRNKTMHPKKTYTRKEALRVIESAGDFLRHVSERLFRGRSKKTP